MTTTNKPALYAYTVTGDGRDAFWTRIGSAWPHTNGEGFTLELNALPVTGRIVLRVPKSGHAAEGRDAS